MDKWIETTDNPIDIFKIWFEEAGEADNFEPTAMTLATVDADGMPSGRVVLLKEFGEEGFCFFTNFESIKAEELLNNPKAALVFHWAKPFHRQVRVRGTIEKMNYERSNTYFQTRERGSQIGAWSSPQSQEIESREFLENRVKEFEEKFSDTEILCPQNWGGFCLSPVSIEFWEAREHRLHDRMKFTKDDKIVWKVQRLAP